MRCDNPTPRVGFAQLKGFVGRSVIFVGKVETMDNGLVVMQAPDGSRVNVQATSHFEAPFVEVTGTVVDPQTIRETSHVSYGDAFGACARVCVRVCWGAGGG
jgi:hypothetical protein